MNYIEVNDDAAVACYNKHLLVPLLELQEPHPLPRMDSMEDVLDARLGWRDPDVHVLETKLAHVIQVIDQNRMVDRGSVAIGRGLEKTDLPQRYTMCGATSGNRVCLN